MDPHFTFGKNQVYPAGRFADHLKPFRAAIDAGVSSIMPYYDVPVGLRHEGASFGPTGMAFSRQIVTHLLRSRLGFEGYVNSDTGIITDRAWGLETKTVPERVAAAINSGTDVLSGFHDKQTITDLVKSGLVPEARLGEAVARLLKEQFLLGLFENPYVDAAKAAAIVGRDEFRAKALDAQRRSIVLLQNRGEGRRRTLPRPAPTPARPIRLYTMGLNTSVVGGAEYGRYTVASKAVMKEVGAERTVLCVYCRQPYVLDEASGLRSAGAILAGFGVSDSALMDVITGRFEPRGRLPFALAANLQAVVTNDPDAPGYPAADTLYPFGYGLGYGRDPARGQRITRR